MLFQVSNGYLHVSGASMKMKENPTQTGLYFARHILSLLYEL
jgi:hypothetical protein